MKIVECAQGSPEWLEARMCRPTASEFKNLFTAKLEPRKWSTDMPNNYLAAKLAERWTGTPDEGFTSFAMEQGSIREHQAIPWYEGIYEEPITRVGFVISDDGKVGCSPDGLFAADGGIEVKVPLGKTHVGYLLAHSLPEEYAPQVHGSIYVCAASFWKFMSWRHDMPKLVLTIERDAAIMDRFADALGEFNERFERGWERLIEMNGGETPVRKIETEISKNGVVTKRIKPDWDNPVFTPEQLEWFNEGVKS